MPDNACVNAALPPAPDVLVVAYRRADLVASMIDSVRAMLPESRILVWDNRSDGTQSVRELAQRHPEVTWIFHDSNAGFAAGVNGLMQHSTSDQVLLLNPDAELLSDLAGCRRLLAADPGVAAAAPWMDSGDGHKRWDNAHREPNPVRQLVTYAGYDERVRRLPALSMFYGTQPSTVSGYLTGACLLISRAAWDVVGPFDERYFLYSEETDWCRRARDRGYRLVAVPEPGIRHVAAGTVADDQAASSRSSQLLEESRVRYLGDHYGAGAARAFTAGVSLLGRVQRSRRR